MPPRRALIVVSEFSREERQGVYKAIHKRRDIRMFRPDPVPDDVLARILEAAHHAPSVGFMQPWNFLLVRDLEVRKQVKAMVERERRAAADKFEEPRRTWYLSFKLEGVLEAPLNLCVTCDPTRNTPGSGAPVIGRNTIRETDLYSTSCAVENLWLAARAEGLGVGWVSILRNEELCGILGIPEPVVPVAYLCVGYPTEFRERPLLEAVGWAPRLSLEELVFFERWGAREAPGWGGVRRQLARDPSTEP